MAAIDVTVFELERGRAALEKYAAVNHLTVQIYGPDGRLVGGPVNRTPLFDLVARGRGPEMFAACALRCLGQRLLKIVFKMLTDKKPYDAELHARNQQKHGSWVLQLIQAQPGE